MAIGAIAALSAIGVGIQAIGGLFGARSSERAARQNADIRLDQSEVRRQQARDAILRGEFNANRVLGRARQQVALGKVGLAAGNVELGSGSAQAWEDSIDTVAESDAELIRRNAEAEALGFELGADALAAEASMLQRQARQTEVAGRIGALTTILSGASSVGAQAFALRTR